MKTHFCFSIIAAALFSACSQTNEELKPTNSEVRTPMTFSIGEDTRAEVRDVASIYSDGFRISICCDNTAMANNGMAAWNGTSFTTTPTVYWPAVSESAPAKFFALSYPGIPNAPIQVQENGSCTFNYTVQDKAKSQQDVLLAVGTATEIPKDGRVSLRFTHALTKVNFSVYVDNTTNHPENDGYVWKVSSIQLKARKQGTCTFPAQSNKQPTWTTTGELAHLQYLDTDAAEQPALQANEAWDGQNNFMLIPQSGQELTVTLSWLVYRKMGTTLVQVSQGVANKDYSISTSGWKPGASLRYSDLRLPNIGEKTAPDEGDGTDDNNMKLIDYNPDCDPFND